MSYNLLMAKAGLETKIEPARPPPSTLASGEVLLEIDRFAITANVVSIDLYRSFNTWESCLVCVRELLSF